MTDSVETINVAQAPSPSPNGKSTSADDLLKIYEAEEANAANSAGKKADEEIKVKEEIAKKETANEIVKKLEESDYEELQEKKEEVEEEASGEEVSEGFKALVDGKETSLPENAEFQIEMNGKEMKFNLKDALEAKLGQEDFNRNMDTRLNYLASEKRKFQADKERAVRGISDVVKKAQETGDPMDMFAGFIRVLNPNITPEAMADAQLSLMKEIQRQAGVPNAWSEEEAKQFKLNTVNKQYRVREEHRSKQEQLDAGDRALQGEIHQRSQELGITPVQFAELFHLLAEHETGEGKMFASPDQITPQDVANAHIHISTSKAVKAAFMKVDKELLNQKDIVNLVFDEVLNEGFSVDEIAEIIRAVQKNSSESVQNLNRKVEKAKSKALNSQIRAASATKKEGGSKKLDEDEEFFLGNRYKPTRPYTAR